jgi:hypothetical protein
MEHAYRTYFVYPGNHITKRIDLPYCYDDETAKVCASRMVEWLAVELWDGDRIVATFEPKMH